MEKRMEQSKTSEQARTGLTGFDWKGIALLFMILDHIHTYLGLFPAWVALLPRFVAPLFVYFLVEGFCYTRNRKAYALRLYTAAGVMWAGNILINFAFHNVDRRTGQVTFFSLVEGNNIFWTLAIFFSVLCLIEAAKKSVGAKRIAAILGAALLGIFSLAGCEGGFYLLPMLLLFYFGRGHKNIVVTGVLIWSALLFGKALMGYLSGATGDSLFGTLCFDSEWMMAVVIFPILFYNGRRGKNTALAKWMFYIIYPLHLWVLMIFRYLFL